jgi:ankyrin repeat protein
VNVADLWKFTPLHEAAAKGKFEICKLLLKVGIIIIHNLYFDNVFTRTFIYLHM